MDILQKHEEVIICYRNPGWNQVYIHYGIDGRWTRSPGMLMTDAWWLSKDGWWVSHIEIDRYSEADSIEFVLTNGDGDWDKAHHGGNLQASLEHKVVCVIGGKVEPVTQAPPIMLISDLDGTMIGDDEATARFSAFWEARHEAAVSVFSGSVPCLQSLRELCAQGSMLVYSTGRSLASVEELLKDKEVRWIKPTDDMFDGVVTQDRNCVGL